MTDEELQAALDGLYAYDTGCIDSGVHDEALRARCIAELHSRLGDHEVASRYISRLIRDMYLSEAALADGYGIEDAISFTDWLGDHMGVCVR